MTRFLRTYDELSELEESMTDFMKATRVGDLDFASYFADINRKTI